MMNQRILLWNAVRGWETQLFAPAGDSELESMVPPSLWQTELEIWVSWRSEETQMKWKAGRAVSQSLGSGQTRQVKKHRLEPNIWSGHRGEQGERTKSVILTCRARSADLENSVLPHRSLPIRIPQPTPKSYFLQIEQFFFLKKLFIIIFNSYYWKFYRSPSFPPH